MKKITVIIAIIVITLCISKQEKVIIPKEAIRFRVIANSNSAEDQNLKKKVVSNLNKNIQMLEFKPKDLSSSRKQIKESIPKFKETIEKTLQENKTNNTYTINYGLNYFPEKEYKGVIYEEGEYESVVITLGNGLGENFWCVLFPPLCLLEGEETESEDIEYTSFIKELIDKYF